jgi:hypothetical protein
LKAKEEKNEKKQKETRKVPEKSHFDNFQVNFEGKA